MFTDLNVFFKALSFDSKLAFLISMVLLLISLFLFLNKQKGALTFFFLGGLSLALGFALIDPYLHLWDEKFHALVAKNLSETPLHPRLLNSDMVAYSYKLWNGNYTWLHKPPLALFQIALSIKLFGADILAVRAPSILLHVLTSILVYRIGVNIFTRNVGYFAALVYLLLHHNLELVSGVKTADHIDSAFIFYITASIWAFIRYQKTKGIKWVYLIGLFVGLAILTKWIVGLLVFSGWGVYLIIYRKECPWIEWKRMIYALFLSIIIASPWFIYTALMFPYEFQHEMAYNTLHFTGVIEDHGGDYFFYWENLKTLFGRGDVIPWLIIVSFLFLWWSINEKKHVLFFYVWILVVYLFFTLAKTKMSGFVTIVSPLLVLTVVAFIMKVKSIILTRIKPSRVVLYSINGVLVLFLFTVLLRPHTTLLNHSLDDSNARSQRIKEINFLKNSIPGGPNDIYFLNEATNHYNIDLMFYHPSTAINRAPQEKEVKKLLEKGYTIYVLYTNNKPQLDISGLKYMELFSE